MADLPQGGFDGIVEKRLVMSPRVMPSAGPRTDISHGFGDLVYLAMGHFQPNDGARMHPHQDIDIVTVVLSGAIAHAGSLGDGTVIHASGVQVQRAGTGMQHLEISADDRKAEFVQIWFLPPKRGYTPDYQNFELPVGALTTVLGGECKACFDNNMTCHVGTLTKGNTLDVAQPFLVVITEGEGVANGKPIAKGDLIEGDALALEATSDLGVVVVF